jgi:prepilin-type N-terminal cleavage/methylation domain-containing protein
MRKRRGGFTIIELMMVVTVIAILAGFFIANLIRCRAAANEATTMATLKMIVTQEAVFRCRGEIDQNQNGLGEFGLLGELSGELALRPGTTHVVNPPYLSQQLTTGGNKGNGTAHKSGYLYTLYLSTATPDNPNAAGNDLDLGGNNGTGGPAANAAALGFQEMNFAVYAWPAELRHSGQRAFFVNEIGDIYTTRMDANTYDGVAAKPAAGAAYVTGAPALRAGVSSRTAAATEAGPPAVPAAGAAGANRGPLFRARISSGKTPGNDGNHWQPVGG